MVGGRFHVIRCLKFIIPRITLNYLELIEKRKGLGVGSKNH